MIALRRQQSNINCSPWQTVDQNDADGNFHDNVKLDRIGEGKLSLKRPSQEKAAKSVTQRRSGTPLPLNGAHNKITENTR